MKYFGKGIPLCLKADIFGDTCQNKTAPLILIHGLFGRFEILGMINFLSRYFSKQNWRSIARSLQVICVYFELNTHICICNGRFMLWLRYVNLVSENVLANFCAI